MARTLAVVSGGMDSVAMAHGLYDDGDLYGIVSFDYGQRHIKELQFAKACADRLGVSWWEIPMVFYGANVKSALTDNRVDVPEGHYTEESMKATVVPNRNMVMLSMATGLAISNQFDSIATAVHAGDHAIYPDCRPKFIAALQYAIRVGNEGFIHPKFEVRTPFILKTKAEIADYGDRHKVPWQSTWSCYKGGKVHCGTCATCIERMEAFLVAKVEDPTYYVTWDKYDELREQGKVGQPQPFAKFSRR